MSEAPTTEELLDDAESRTGLARGQLLMLVAKSATVRHLACHPDYRDLFVLKGGTLLSNVYRSPRQSIKDADYTYLDPQTLRAPELERALTIDGEYGFHLAPQEVFSFDRDMFDGDPPFSMDGITLGLRGRDRELKITVSVRAGERLDPPAEKLFYYDPLLARDQRFEVNGLTRDELAAEKTLAWCSKPLSKHFVDLAYLAREHHEHIDRDKVADLVCRKFKAEGRSNCGTLVPFLLDGVEPRERFTVNARMVYSSLVFEGTRLTRTDLTGGTFLNASFDGTDWDDVKFVDCDLGEPTFSRQSRYHNVAVRDSRLPGVRVVDGPEEEIREYAPERIRLVLASLGVTVEHSDTAADKAPTHDVADGETRRLTKRLLNAFRRTTILSEVILKRRFPRDASAIFEIVIPLMTRHGVLDQRAWHGSGVQQAWGLGSYRLEDIERADGDELHALHVFWQEVNAIDARVGHSKRSRR